MAILAQAKDNYFMLEGDVSKDTVPALVESGWAQLAASSAARLTIDFSAATQADSAALAMLLEWMKRAQSISKPLVFVSFSAELKALAIVCGIEQFFIDGLA